MRLTYSSVSGLRPACLVSENALELDSSEDVCGRYKRGGHREGPGPLDAVGSERCNRLVVAESLAVEATPCSLTRALSPVGQMHAADIELQNQLSFHQYSQE